MPKHILIVVGVAGGANAATRLRRLDEKAEIVVFERGRYVSFANCGPPYHIGGEIQDRSAPVRTNGSLSEPECRSKRSICIPTHMPGTAQAQSLWHSRFSFTPAAESFLVLRPLEKKALISASMLSPPRSRGALDRRSCRA